MAVQERYVLVSDHAAEAYRRRLSDRRPKRILIDEISACVEQGVRDGRVFNHKPEGFVLYRRRSNALPEGQRFVQCDDRYGFVLKRLPSGEDIVVTMLTRVGVRR